MAIIQNVNISGICNFERYFVDVFKKVGKHDLEKVEINGSVLTLYFDEKENPSAKNFLKQMSLKKYASEAEFIVKTALSQRFETHIAKITTPKHILFFFSEKSRKKD